jgi:hypothetical protein
MKNLLLISIALLFGLGCSKSNNNTASSGNSQVYTVNGLSDITVPQYLDTTIYVLYNIKFESGTQEPVSIVLENLPAGLTASPASVSGTPTFGAQFTLRLHMTTTGTFPVTVTANSGSAAKKTFTFNIVVTPATQFSYQVSGPDVTFFRYDTAVVNLPLSVTYLDGIKETVVLLPDSIPAGVAITYATNTGTPDFATTFYLRINPSMPLGTYPITIHASSPSTVTKSYKFNLQVISSPDCAAGIAGSYSANTTCVSYSGAETGIHSLSIGHDASSTNMASLEIPFSSVLLATLNCTTRTFTTASGTIGGSTLTSGSGTFVHYPLHDTVVYHYTLSGTINSTCTTKYAR